MMQLFCFYNSFHNKFLLPCCHFLDNKNEVIKHGIYDYLTDCLTGDLCSLSEIEVHLNIITQTEMEPEEHFDGGGQNFLLVFHNHNVNFIHNEFDEEDGWPELSCSLSFFKNVLLAWQAFLQLPKSIHTRLETVIED